MSKCKTCGEEIRPNCDWQQGRCPHLPSMAEMILSDPYKTRYLNLINTIKKWFKQ